MQSVTVACVSLHVVHVLAYRDAEVNEPLEIRPQIDDPAAFLWICWSIGCKA